MGTGFYGSYNPTNSVKALKEEPRQQYEDDSDSVSVVS